MPDPRHDLRTKGKSVFAHVGTTFPLADKNAPTVVIEDTQRLSKLPGAIGSTLPGFGAQHPDSVDYPNCFMVILEADPGDNTDRKVKREYHTLPGTLLTEYTQDDQYLLPFTRTTQDVLASTAAPVSVVIGQQTTFQPKNAVESTKIVDAFDSTINTYFLTFPGTDNIEFPKRLAALISTWDIGIGSGSFSENGSGFATGSSANLSIALEGSGQGSGSVLGDLSPVYFPQPPANLPVLDYFFFLPDPVTLSAIITRCTQIATALAGTPTTVNQWPVFMEQEHTFIVIGQKVSVSARATAKCAVSLGVGSGANAPSVSENTGSGKGTNEDVGSSVKAVNLGGCIHGALSVIGITSIGAAGVATASAVVAPGQNWPGASSSSAEAAGALGSITPTSIAATPSGDIPASGLYLYKPDVGVYKWGYSTVRARIFDFGVLSGTVSLGQPQITTVDFNGLTGANFVKSAVQITTVNFTGLTGANFIAALQQVTTVGFVGLTGAHFTTSIPQITTVDFTGLTGASFVTGSAGKGFTLPSTGTTVFGVWFNTGTETQPTLSGATNYFSVSISATATAAAIATALKTAVAGTGVWTTASSGAVTTLTSNALIAQTAANDVNTGAAFIVTQFGSQNAGLGFILPSASNGTFGVWFNTGTETQPNLSTGSYIEIPVARSDSASTLASDFATAMAAQSAIWTTTSSGTTATITSVARATQAAATEVNSGTTITVVQNGATTGAGRGFTLPSSSPTLGIFGIWFDTGTETQPSLGNGVATYVKVPITTGSSASTIASALATAFSGYSALWTVGAASATTTFTSISFAAQGNASDVNTGTAITVTQAAGVAAGNYFLIYGYHARGTAIWFNTGNEIAPSVSGATISVAISPTASASDIAAAVVAAVPAAVGQVWVMQQTNGGGTGTLAQFTGVSNQTTTNAADVNTGAGVFTVQSGQPPNV